MIQHLLLAIITVNIATNFTHNLYQISEKEELITDNLTHLTVWLAPDVASSMEHHHSQATSPGRDALLWVFYPQSGRNIQKDVWVFFSGSKPSTRVWELYLHLEVDAIVRGSTGNLHSAHSRGRCSKHSCCKNSSRFFQLLWHPLTEHTILDMAEMNRHY